MSDDRRQNDDDDGITGVVIETKPRTKKPSLYKVLMLNDDYTPREFVITVLKTVFRMSEDEAYPVMMAAHSKGSCVVAVYTKDVAETRIVIDVVGCADLVPHIKIVGVEAFPESTNCCLVIFLQHWIPPMDFRMRFVANAVVVDNYADKSERRG